MSKTKKKVEETLTPEEIRELSKDLEETTDMLIDANQFIESYGLSEEWNECKQDKFMERTMRKKKNG
jgi:hypothetical protein